MKILAIGDPHGDLKTIRKIPIKDIDLILLTGDLGSSSLMRKMAFENIERRRKGLPEKEFSPKQMKMAFVEAYSTSISILKYLSKFAPVYTIFGNVESSDVETRKYARDLGLPLPSLAKACKRIKKVRILNNKLVKLKDISIGGLEYFLDTSWVSNFKPAEYLEAYIAAAESTARAKKALNKFGKVDILVCHQPPLGYLDKVSAKFAPKHWQGKNAGSKAILEYVRKKQPKYVFCGHIHEGKGKARIGKSVVYNLGVCGWKIIRI